MKFSGEWISEFDPVENHGPYLVTCQYLDDRTGEERFTDVSAWLGDMWEITAPGNDYVRPFRVVAWTPYPAPAKPAGRGEDKRTTK